MLDHLDHRRRTGFAILGMLLTVGIAADARGQGSDTPADAPPIAVGVPTLGTTAGYADDMDFVCPYTGSTSPDVFYAYTGEGESLDVSLCNSGYDTKVYVFDAVTGELLPTKDGSANGVACNDDFCSSPQGGGFRSFLGCVQVLPGQDVRIGVDGWGGDAGPYEILVTLSAPDGCEPPGPCIVECPPGATIEPDDCDFGNTAPDDQVNGGCNTSPPAFTSIACDEVVCGTAYFDGTFRDTDWWELDHTDANCGYTYEINGIAEFSAVFGRIDNACGAFTCGGILEFAELGVFEPCQPASLVTARLVNCLAWFFVAPNFSEIIDCNQPAGGPPAEIGERYILEVGCSANGAPCPWDLDGDSVVGFADLLKILSFWGACPPGGPCPWDFDGDGMVGFSDLLKLLALWGPCPCTA